MVWQGRHITPLRLVGDTVEPRDHSAVNRRVERFGCFAGAAIAPPSIGNDADTDMPNPLHPDLMTPAERLDEIAEILAAGILPVRARVRAPRGSTAEQVRLDFSPRRSGHARPSGERRRRA
jgi:hypothetical protein